MATPWSRPTRVTSGAALVGDQLEVVGLAADDAADRDQRVVLVLVGQGSSTPTPISSAPGTVTCVMSVAATPRRAQLSAQRACEAVGQRR
jgi:hypothetical protein